MADARRKHPANVDGPWFVDESCIDCGATRQLAPGLIAAVGGGSAFLRQPATEEEERAAWRALLACPVGAVGVSGSKPAFRDTLPQELADGVYYCGYNSPKSYGANAFFARRAAGNILVDSPRYAPQLVRRLEAMGGVEHLLLTHRDDVADAERYATHFGARVWIHEDDGSAAPFATDIIRGGEPVVLQQDVVAVQVPGHTRGSVAFLLEGRFLFSGDSLHWSRDTGDLSAFRDYCWYSWEAQTASLARLAAYPFEWLLAGHGDRRRAPADEMRGRLLALVERMRLPRSAWPG